MFGKLIKHLLNVFVCVCYDLEQCFLGETQNYPDELFVVI